MNDAKLEARLLTAAELELVAVTRPPEIDAPVRRRAQGRRSSPAGGARSRQGNRNAPGARDARQGRAAGRKAGAGQFGHLGQGAGFARRARAGGGGAPPPRRGAVAAFLARRGRRSSERPLERGCRDQRSRLHRATAPFPARSPCPCTGSSASPRRRRPQSTQGGRRERRGSPASRSCIPCRPNIAGRRSAIRVPTDPP